MPVYKRILLKLSGESLMGAQKYGLDTAVLNSYATQIKAVVDSGVQVGIVIGGGNIFRGLSGVKKGFDRVKGDQMGMLATVINSLALQTALEGEGAKAKVLTSIRMEPIGELYSKAKALELMAGGCVVIIAGGTGNPYFTTDTASALRGVEIEAEVLLKGTRVDGVYTADPRIVKDAKKLDAITYDEMLELASLGAQVLHNRSVEMAKKYNVDLEVVSSFTRNPGTKVKEGSNMEKLLVSGVARDNNCARVAIINLDDTPGTAFKVFSLMAKHNVNIDIILQSVGRDNKKSISFTIRQDDAERVEKILRDAKEMLGYEDISINTKVAKVSIVGAGMASATGVASKMFEALASAGINIRMISTSEIKISVLINEEDSEKAVKAIHEEFFNA